MNSSLQGKLSEVVGANNISYILSDNSSFSMTGYKVMQNYNGAGLLKCARLNYNGKIKLVYIVSNLKPLSHVATRLGVNELTAVIFNLIQRALEIKANGFFCAENLELDFDKIFVDTSDDSVHLIYFPVTSGAGGKISGFENEFRIALINLFNSFPIFNAPQFQRLCSDLSNGSLPLEFVVKKLQDSISGNGYNQIGYDHYVAQDYSARPDPVPSPQPNPYDARPDVWEQNRGYHHQQDQRYQRQYEDQRYQQQPQDQRYQQQEHRFNGGHQHVSFEPVPQKAVQPTMTITAINTPMQVSLVINTPEFVIGKNPDMVNGAVTHNPAISRVHCKVSFEGGKYYLTDLGSANGTFVNELRLEKQQTVEIHNGDYIKLANSDFIIAF